MVTEENETLNIKISYYSLIFLFYFLFIFFIFLFFFEVDTLIRFIYICKTNDKGLIS